MYNIIIWQERTKQKIMRMCAKESWEKMFHTLSHIVSVLTEFSSSPSILLNMYRNKMSERQCATPKSDSYRNLEQMWLQNKLGWCIMCCDNKRNDSFSTDPPDAADNNGRFNFAAEIVSNLRKYHISQYEIKRRMWHRDELNAFSSSLCHILLHLDRAEHWIRVEYNIDMAAEAKKLT